MNELLNSIRMRAERDGKHISGSERLIGDDQLIDVALELVQRALRHPRGQARQIKLRVDPVLPASLQTGKLPDLYNYRVGSWQQGRRLATSLLTDCGVSAAAADKAMAALANGAAPGGKSMRGAMLVDADSGERLEADPARGVRASRMDLSASARAELRARLALFQLDNPHVVEALTLAAKVISAPGMVAELCWSDDPDYLAGYVASARSGYQRINLLKPQGEQRGGRAFFVRCERQALDVLVDWLQRQPLLIDRIGEIHPPQLWSESP